MTTVRQLYELQELDWEIDQRQAELDAILARLRDDRALAQAREDLQAREARVHDLRLQRGIQDLSLRDLQAKVKALEARLYGGSIRKQQELESIQNERGHLGAQVQAQEEKFLTVEIELEELEQGIARLQRELKEMEKSWEATKATLLEQQGALEQGLTRAREQRKVLAAATPPEDLGRYEHLRGTRRGHAVSKVERGMCSGCRMALPTRELQRVRTGRELVPCTSCGRILYLS